MWAIFLSSLHSLFFSSSSISSHWKLQLLLKIKKDLRPYSSIGFSPIRYWGHWCGCPVSLSSDIHTALSLVIWLLCYGGSFIFKCLSMYMQYTYNLLLCYVLNLTLFILKDTPSSYRPFETQCTRPSSIALSLCLSSIISTGILTSICTSNVIIFEYVI